MFGFVTFVYPETVKLILAKGNPHFICDARVLVKPYKEKGKVPDKYRQAALPRQRHLPCASGNCSSDAVALASRLFALQHRDQLLCCCSAGSSSCKVRGWISPAG
jgi:hypothetical protein